MAFEDTGKMALIGEAAHQGYIANWMAGLPQELGGGSNPPIAQ